MDKIYVVGLTNLRISEIEVVRETATTFITEGATVSKRSGFTEYFRNRISALRFVARALDSELDDLREETASREKRLAEIHREMKRINSPEAIKLTRMSITGADRLPALGRVSRGCDEGGSL